jgi:hypothetical protein
MDIMIRTFKSGLIEIEKTQGNQISPKRSSITSMTNGRNQIDQDQIKKATKEQMGKIREFPLLRTSLFHLHS